MKDHFRARNIAPESGQYALLRSRAVVIWRKDPVQPLETLPLPEDPFVAAAASVLNDAGHWAYVLDARWRIVFATDELRQSFGDTGATTCVPVEAS